MAGDRVRVGVSAEGLAAVPIIDQATLQALVSMSDAVAGLEAALIDGSAPGRVPARTGVEVEAGQVLLMPASSTRYVGVKVVSIAPDNPGLGRPRIQGVYLLMDAEGLSPVALIDGVALTNLRTPATSALAVSRLADPRARTLVLFGTGPQGYGHIAALQEVRPLRRLTLCARNLDAAKAMAQWAMKRGLSVEVVMDQGDRSALRAAVRAADLVVCATTAREPLFDGQWLREDAVVVAIGSHEPDAREVDSSVVVRSSVIVESRETALREAGDLLIPIRRGECGDEVIHGDLTDLVNARLEPLPAGPRLFKGCGEAWQDLVVASLAYERSLASMTIRTAGSTGSVRTGQVT